MKPEARTGVWRELCGNCQREKIRLAANGPGSFLVVLCESCDPGAVARMWGES